MTVYGVSVLQVNVKAPLDTDGGRWAVARQHNLVISAAEELIVDRAQDGVACLGGRSVPNGTGCQRITGEDHWFQRVAD